MSRFRLTIAYDGRPFAGWQSQKGGNSIQDVVEAGLFQIGGEPIRLHGSGRTDKGVHALGQVAHFDAPEGNRLSEADWLRALNAVLPPTVRIMRCDRAEDDFHARFHATGKIYRYRIWNDDVLPPLELGLAWHVYGCLNEMTLRRSALLFEGSHDFSSFSALRGEEGESEQDRVRIIHQLSVHQQGPLIELIFEGTGFLYKMVRMITGALIHVSRGRATPERLAELLANPSTQKPGWQAPSDGLYLVKVNY